MTKFDKLKTMDIKDVATELCVAISDHIEDCEKCPFAHRCYKGNNGVLDFLMEEVEE